jgi:RNA-binding protein
MSPDEKKSLAAKAHHLKPVVIVGAKGLTDSVLNEVDLALTAHELIKVRLNGEKAEREEMQATILARLEGTVCVQSIGHVVAIYRKNP